jgi:hypothetical protein
MEKLSKNNIKYQWNDEFQQSLDILKENMVTMPILVFPDWVKEFHVLVDASAIVLGGVLTQPREGDIDQPITFSRRKFSYSEQNYNTIEREGLAMVYALQKFRQYLLGKYFKMFIDHFSLIYLVNKTVLGGRIRRWLLLFQEFDFEFVVKPRRFNGGPNNLSRITNGE